MALRNAFVLLLWLVMASANASDVATGRFSLEDVFTPVISRNGMVVSEEELASAVGAEILRRGGNAVDAAVATGFALAVVLPEAGNLAGGGFMLVHLQQPQKTIAIDYREMAPQKSTRDMFVKKDGHVDHDELDHGAKSIAVPGTIAGFDYALKKYGTMKWADVIAPAIKLAKEGFVLNSSHAASLRSGRERLLLNKEAKRVYFKKDGSSYQQGERLVLTDLAASLTALQKNGAKVFYEGSLGKKMLSDIRRLGAVMTADDLKHYKVIEREAVHGDYRGYQIYSMPPPSSGGVHLIQMLNMLEGFDMAALGSTTAASSHILIETMRRAYADRSEYLGDPDFVNVPVAALTDKNYAAQLREQIDLHRATPSFNVKPGNLAPYESKQTTHYSIVDKWGNAVANTYTLNWSYGSAIVAKGTGMLMNNQMDDFSAKPGEPNIYGLIGGEANAVAQRKRPLSSMTPTIVMKEGNVFLVTGSPGGSQIITSVLQVIVNVLDHQHNIQMATNAPRLHHQWMPDEVLVEAIFNRDTVDLLRARGHKIEPSLPIGTTQSIMVMDDGSLHGASDPRRAGGRAMGY